MLNIAIILPKKRCLIKEHKSDNFFEFYMNEHDKFKFVEMKALFLGGVMLRRKVLLQYMDFQKSVSKSSEFINTISGAGFKICTDIRKI